MARDSLSDRRETGAEPHRVCTEGLARAFGFLGKRWNGVILGTLMEGPATFSELSRAVEGISDSVLSERLVGLATAGLVVRTVTGGRPVSVTYTLSASGQALMPSLHELTKWAEANLPAAACTGEVAGDGDCKDVTLGETSSSGGAARGAVSE